MKLTKTNITIVLVAVGLTLASVKALNYYDDDILG